MENGFLKVVFRTEDAAMVADVLRFHVTELMDNASSNEEGITEVELGMREEWSGHFRLRL